MSGYELEVAAAGRVVSRRRLVRPETVIGGHEACDVCLTLVPAHVQAVLRQTLRGIEVFGARDVATCRGRAVTDGWLWIPGQSLSMAGHTLELRAHVSRTATHEETVRVAEDLQVRAGAVAVPLSTKQSTVIGASQADLNVVHRSVAARHAKIEWRGGGYYVVDLESGHETLVNGRVVAPGATGARLRLGDQLMCGTCALDIELRGEVHEDGLVGESEAWQAVRAQLAAVAHEAVVTIIGEPGTGKALVAHALHGTSARKGRMVVLNGAALSSETSRSALFGHTRGAFSDAIADRAGALGAASNGTLLLTEAGAIHHDVQTQLLRVVEEEVARQVGATSPTSRLAHLVFSVRPQDVAVLREDFKARLGNHQILLPPLRDRGEDVILIAEQRLAAMGCKVRLSRSAKAALRAHRWPGNVRELLNTIERAVASLPEGTEVLEAEALGITSAAAVRAVVPRGRYSEALVAAGGNLVAASKALGTSRFLFEKGLGGEGFTVKEIRDAVKTHRAEVMRQVVLEEGGFAAAGRKLGMSDKGVSGVVGPLEGVSREAIEMRLQGSAGDVASVAEDLGMSARALWRRMGQLGAFGGAPRGPLGWLVIEGPRGGAQRHPVDELGFAVGTRGDNDVVVEEGPPLLALVVQRGARLGLRVHRGEGVRAAGGLLLHAATLDLDVGEGVRVGATRVHLESDATLDAPAGRGAESVALCVGEARHIIHAKGALTVGTDPSRSDVVVDDPHVSGAHLRIFEAAGQWHVRDLVSKNGTYVRGELHAAGEVRVPAPIRIGDVELRLEWETPRVWTKTHGFIGRSPPMQHVYATLDRAKDARTVLVTGETGTGKELASRALHALWGGGPLVVVNCGGVSDELLHLELMGHVKGAFTGATEDKEGLIAQADGGTLFLDEIGDMSMRLQRQLLGVLDDGSYTPAGVDLPRKADVRVVAATNRDLETMVAEGAFDAALRYRFVHEIHLPPLRERGDEDLFELAEYLLEGMDGWRATPEALEALKGQRWPRNVRELRNVLQAAIGRAERARNTSVRRLPKG